jgi:virginiamycin B lyase
MALSLAALAVAAWYWLTPRAVNVVEYPMRVATDIPTALAIAPDGTVWFSIDFSDALGAVRGGQLERIAKGSRSVEPMGIAVDTQGTVWMTDAAAVAIVGYGSQGKFQTVKLGTPIARLGRMSAAPDGSVWFAESTAYSITRLKDGVLTRNPIPSTVRGGPFGVAVAPDGSVWATLQSGNSLLRIAPDGSMTEHELPTPGAQPTDVAVDASGAVWFVEFRGDKIGRFADGKFTELAVPVERPALSGLAVAPDGTVWFGLLRGRALGRVRTGKVEVLRLPRENTRPMSVAVDRAGNVWYADIGGFVGMLPAQDAAR